MTVTRRFYEEIVDAANPELQTAPPLSLVPKGEKTLESKGQTDLPKGDYGEDEIAAETPKSRYPVVGRTWPDLLYSFFNKPPFVPMTTTFGAFLISIGHLHRIGDVWRPALIAGTLNVIWYGWKIVSNIRKRRQKGTEDKLVAGK